MKFQCVKHSKIIGSAGIYVFKGGFYETENKDEIKELCAIKDVAKVNEKADEKPKQ